MARAEVVHSEDGVCVVFNGNPKRPEPSLGVIKFPGGHVEVSRCSDGTYWCHLEAFDSRNIVDSRIDYMHAASQSVTDLPEAKHVKKLALRIAATVRPPEEIA